MINGVKACKQAAQKTRVNFKDIQDSAFIEGLYDYQHRATTVTFDRISPIFG